MKGYAMLKIGESGWIEKERPKCGPMDAICRPLAVAICTSDVHTLWEGAIGDRHNMILGHECCAEVVEVGELAKDFKPGDRVLVPAITPDWNSLEAQAGYSMHSGGMLAGWKFSNFKDGVFSEFFHVNDADGNLALLPKNINVVDACMLSDMVPTGFHGVELADVQFGDTVCHRNRTSWSDVGSRNEYARRIENHCCRNETGLRRSGKKIRRNGFCQLQERTDFPAGT